jgi:tetratricopeptide (TPR) repeat protein
MQLMPTSWMVYLELANTETGMEKYEAALRHIEQAEVLQPRNSHSDARAMMHFLKGCVFMRIGNQIRARPELERVIKEKPNSELARQSRQVLAQPQLPED